MISLDLYKVVIHKINISNWQQHKNRILSLVPFSSEKFNTNEELSYSDYFEKDRHYGDELLDVIKPHLADFEKMYKICDFGVPWCQGYLHSDWHSPHNHGSQGYSCIFYANYDSEVHQPTEYTAPFPDIFGNIGGARPEVEEGDLVIFPSFLVHTAPPSGSDKERIIFSFNLKVELPL